MNDNLKDVEFLMLEIKKRKENEQGTLKVIGAELKSKRLELAKTLKSVSSNLCSISYASKLENNSINSNRYIINEYGKKVGLDGDKIQLLYDLKSRIIECVNDYFYEQYDKIKDFYEECLELVNYRSIIVKLIYSLVTKNMIDAYKYIQTIIKISSTLTDFDLAIFGLFYSIYLHHSGLFESSLKIIESLESYDISKIYIIIKKQYEFYNHIALNSNFVIGKYSELRELLIDMSEYDKIDKFMYYLCISFLKKNDLLNYHKYFNSIKNNNYKNALTIIYDYRYNKFFNSSKYELTNIIFSDALIYISKDPEKAKKYLINDNIYYVDYSYYILKYLITLKLEPDNILDVIKECVDYSSVVNDTFLKEFIYKMAVKYCGQTSKYKYLHDIYVKLWGLS